MFALKLFVVTLLCCIFSTALGQNMWVENQLRTLVQEHLKALEAEDMKALENTIHPDTPLLGQTLEIARQLSTTYDLTYAVGDHWIFLGQDEDYAYARIEQVTRRLDGPSFADNAVDQMWAFSQHNGEWRIRSSMPLSVDYFVPPISEQRQRRSKYTNVNAMFIETDTYVVDCVSHAEFAEFIKQEDVICGLTPSDWDAFQEDASFFLEDILVASGWRSEAGTMSTRYFDEYEEREFQLTFIPGGFVTVVAVDG